MALAVAWMLNQAKGTSDHTITCSSCMKLMIGQYLAHILQDSIPQPRKLILTLLIDSKVLCGHLHNQEAIYRMWLEIPGTMGVRMKLHDIRQ